MSRWLAIVVFLLCSNAHASQSSFQIVTLQEHYLYTPQSNVCEKREAGKDFGVVGELDLDPSSKLEMITPSVFLTKLDHGKDVRVFFLKKADCDGFKSLQDRQAARDRAESGAKK